MGWGAAHGQQELLDWAALASAWFSRGQLWGLPVPLSPPLSERLKVRVRARELQGVRQGSDRSGVGRAGSHSPTVGRADH